MKRDDIMSKKRPPKWWEFDGWVWIGAGVGIVIAFGLFCLVQVLVNGTEAFFDFVGDAKTPLSDIISMTATAIGGLAIGGVAVMQYRKHKWAEYQTAHQIKLDEDTKMGERLSKAIEHLGDGTAGDKPKLHIRLGAIYEFNNLAKDSPRNRKTCVWIITQYIKSYPAKAGKALPMDVNAAAHVLSSMARDLIEDMAGHASEKDKAGPSKSIREATETLSFLAELKLFKWQWKKLNANWLDMQDAVLRGADLEEACFEGANLRGAYLEGTHLRIANLKNTNLSNISMNSETVFYGAKINGRTTFSSEVQVDKSHDKNFITQVVFPKQ
jgi:hypothetical protein